MQINFCSSFGKCFLLKNAENLNVMLLDMIEVQI